MTTEATEKAPEEPAESGGVEETGTIYSDQPGAGPPGSANAPAEEGAEKPATAPETPASAPEATETPVEKGTAKKGA